jgi:ABC-type uncharacterized transport system permease subunit
MAASAPSTLAASPGAALDRWSRIVVQRLVGALEALVVPVLAFGVSLALFGVFVALAGHSPLDVYAEMYRGAARSSVFWNENHVPKAPRYISA